MTTPYYQDDAVTLYLGDCREVTEWLAADVLVTDPPYGISRRQGWNHGETREDRRRNAQVMRAEGVDRIAGDHSTGLRDEILALWGKERPGLVFGSWRKPRPATTVQRLLWIKNSSPFCVGLSQMPWVSGDEEIYVIGPSLARFTGQPRKAFYITTEPRQSAVAEVGHPTPKPLGLMEELVSRCPDGLIADPFAGSGSTLIASKMLGRRAIGVELEERYCEIAARRLAQDVLDFGEATA